MNCAPIGIFDSGVGGISILVAGKNILPNESFIYLMDKKYAPYGTKTDDFIQKRTLDIIDYFVFRGCKAVVIACNTATTSALRIVKEEFSLPIIGVFPPILDAVNELNEGKILFLSTEATARQQEVKRLLDQYKDRVIAAPQRDLATLIDDNIRDLKAIKGQIYGILDNYRGVSGVILGCTHYHFIKSQINEFYNGKVKIFDPSGLVAEKLRLELLKNRSLSEVKSGETEFIIT